MAKWMGPGDPASQEGLVRYPQCLVDCSGDISMGGIPLLQDSEMRKLETFWPAGPRAEDVWGNGWYEEIQRIE